MFEKYVSMKKRSNVGEYWIFNFKEIINASAKGHVITYIEYLKKHKMSLPEIAIEKPEILEDGTALEDLECSEVYAHAYNNFKAIRISGKYVQVFDLNSNTLEAISSFFEKQYPDIYQNMKINIERTYIENLGMENDTVAFVDVPVTELRNISEYDFFRFKARIFNPFFYSKKRKSIKAYSILKRECVAFQNGEYWYINDSLIFSPNGHKEAIHELAKNKKLSKKEKEIYDDGYAPYALGFFWGGIRISSFDCEIPYLTTNILEKVKKAYLKIYSGNIKDRKINIAIRNEIDFYKDIPLEELDMMSLMDLNKYKTRLHWGRKADFGGDFQNVNDVRPNPGNVCPGRNREYLKKQEDLFTKPITGKDNDNGEFVHLHPENCPRYDLRKLKIVDENGDESND